MNAPNQTDPPAFKFFFAVIIIVIAAFLVAVTVTGCANQGMLSRNAAPAAAPDLSQINQPEGLTLFQLPKPQPKPDRLLNFTTKRGMPPLISPPGFEEAAANTQPLNQ